MQRSVLLVGITLVALTLPEPAAANTAVLAPVNQSAVDGSARDAAQGAVRESLMAASYRVVSSEEAQARLQSTQLCVDLDCASSVLAALGADMLVTVALEPAAGSNRAGEALVTLADPEGRYVNGGATVTREDVASAARAAFARAFAKWPARIGIVLRVEGTPEGATVSVDGRPAGVLPLEQTVTPGPHRVVVSQRGFEPWARDVNVVNEPVVLTAGLDSSRPARRGTAMRIAGPVVLGAAGAGLIVAGLVPLSQRGCSEEAPNGECVQQREVSTGPMLAWELGGAALVAGSITWFALARRASASVSIGPHGLRLKGRF